MTRYDKLSDVSTTKQHIQTIVGSALYSLAGKMVSLPGCRSWPATLQLSQDGPHKRNCNCLTTDCAKAHGTKDNYTQTTSNPPTNDAEVLSLRICRSSSSNLKRSKTCPDSSTSGGSFLLEP